MKALRLIVGGLLLPGLLAGTGFLGLRRARVQAEAALDKLSAEAFAWAVPPRGTEPPSWPAALGEAELRLNDASLPGARVENLRARLSGADPARRGKFSQIIIECDRLSRGALVLEDVVLDIRRAQAALAAGPGGSELRLLAAEEIRPSVRVRAETLRTLLASRFSRLRGLQVELRDGVRLRARAAGVPLEALLLPKLAPDKRSLEAECLSLRAAGIALPVSWAGLAGRRFSLEASELRPFRLALESITMEDNVLVLKGRTE